MTQGDNHVTVGEPAPDFELPDSKGETHRLSQYADQVVVLVFWSAECPVSREYDAYFNALPEQYPEGQVVVLGIDSNVNYSMREIRAAVKERGVRFPVLRDEGTRMADRLGAVTTPHVYVIDATGRLAYQGAVDDRTFRQKEATVQYVDEALAAILTGKQAVVTETQPYGCTIVRHH
jgi:peroxiredoxin